MCVCVSLTWSSNSKLLVKENPRGIVKETFSKTCQNLPGDRCKADRFKESLQKSKQL